jgi:SAM-dependent methyltransferase
MLGDARRAWRRARRPAPAAIAAIGEPLSRVFGFDRGTPIDRHYIEAFLDANSDRIRGRVLEVGDNAYSRRFGRGRIECADVLAFRDAGGRPQGSAKGVVTGDLTDPATLPAGRYDCFVCTQVLNFVYDVAAAVRGAHHVLAPGGTLLVTVAGIGPLSRWDADRWGDFWRFTPQSLEHELRDAFGGDVMVRARGNLATATALLHGLAVEDLKERAKLDVDDPDYPVVITAWARRR